MRLAAEREPKRPQAGIVSEAFLDEDIERPQVGRAEAAARNAIAAHRVAARLCKASRERRTSSRNCSGVICRMARWK